MKLHSPVTTGLLAITACDAGSIAVNARALTKSFLLTPQRLTKNWPPDSFAALTGEDLQAAAAALIIECTG